MAPRIDNDPRALLASRQGKNQSKPKAFGLTPRVRRAVELIIYGPDDGGAAPATMAQAAKLAGLSPRSLQKALDKPSVLSFYKAQMRLLRAGHQPGSVRALVEIRDDPALKSSAAGARARAHAISVLQTDPDERSGLSVNVGIGVTVNPDERAGYVIDLSGHPSQPLTIDHNDGERDRVVLDGPDPYEGAAPLLASAGAKEGVGGQNSGNEYQFLPRPRESPIAETPAEYFSPSDENLIRRTDVLPGSLGTLAPGSRVWPPPPEPPRSRRHGPDATHGVGRRRGGN